jgi:hypothetical protein
LQAVERAPGACSVATATNLRREPSLRDTAAAVRAIIAGVIPLELAVLAESLPRWRPPFDSQGFDVPYRARISLALDARDDESLASVMRRAVGELSPEPTDEFRGIPMPFEVSWIWFYRREDESAFLHREYQMAEDLITVDAEGLAHWNRPKDEIPYGDIVRAAEYGLIDGDPQRPYVALLIPQGEGGLHDAWQVLDTVWAWITTGLDVRDVALLGASAIGLRRRLRGRRILGEQRGQLASRGATPAGISRLLERQPWTLPELRMLLGLPDEEAAKAVLALFGFTAGPDGLYRIGEDEEDRLLRLVEAEAFDLGPALLEDPSLFNRLAHILRTGERPPRTF